jgi:hypothetical protein
MYITKGLSGQGMIVNFNCYQQFQGEEEKVGIVAIIAANELYGQILDRCAKGMPAVSEDYVTHIVRMYSLRKAA